MAAEEINIVIGMPSHRGLVATITLSTLLQLGNLFTDLGIRSFFYNIDHAELTHSRNVMANHVLKNHEFTHLLFIDDDMSFDPELILELLRFDKPIGGAICPKRSMDLQKFFETAAEGGSFEQAQTAAAEFVTRHISFSTLSVTGGWCQMAGIGMGITLIKRAVFEEMVKTAVVPARTAVAGADAGNPDEIEYGFFDHIFNEEINSMLSEDLSFCDRWRRQCGGEIWGNANYEIGHIGQMTFKGKYMDRIRSGKL